MSNQNESEIDFTRLIRNKLLKDTTNFVENIISDRSYELFNIDNKIYPLPIWH